ncbi:serine--tRNA ligase [Blochmannia endosymbiont of Polyrhachis (Hedomyrma) turneri]|uniref:serine--tRNA ligase n=1 Tax=Blochmannia endosymbiont of Polyrhachis (Hedomyrma) turneri TaxID=1505596 RepID=UPI00061A718A|nr:serine--tRNA ligase [Blochmannia endosymbiont of Polyrhachis (Hedomyrma) turneri]AKC59949.1 Serine--tRNA ligase [Blochmannia endosymbiont of Polyrhachis (Hedomyrma) turneri]
MLDPSLLRQDNSLSVLKKKLSRKNCVLDINNVRIRELKRKKLQVEVERLRSVRKLKSKTIGIAKSKGQDTKYLCEEVNILNDRLHLIQVSLKLLQKESQEYILSLPNIPDDHIPDGNNEEDNVEIFRWGVPKKYNFPIRDHIELGNITGGLDFTSGTKITGARFIVMRGQVAYLHRALSQFMLDLHIRHHGYQEYYVPYLVNQSSLYGTGQLPKFFNDLFHIQSWKNKNNIYTLIPTAEVPLINLVGGQIFEEQDLPLKMVAHTPCFRAEAGTYGHESRGLIRMHQFDKVELVQIVQQENSMQVLEEMTGHAERVLRSLKLPYRKMLLAAGNIGFSACKTYDLDVWLPSRNEYCEVASCSNVCDFQSRRIHARYRNFQDKKIKFLHTLNASGLAIGRTLAAVLENYQLLDGSVEVPSVLQSYMNGLTCIYPLRKQQYIL